MEQYRHQLQQELQNPQTTAARRLQIGRELAQTGDPRPGVRVHGGVPDIAWLPVALGGEVKVKRIWRMAQPDQADKVIHTQAFPVEPFYIATYLVTNAQYQAFVDAADGFHEQAWWQGMPVEFQRQPLSPSHNKLPNYPRSGLSWYQSVAFARWLNHRLQGLELPDPTGTGTFRVGNNAQIRLPTEWEWQWAAQGGAEARAYPWGDANLGYANTAESGLAAPIAVGMYPHGAAACGALDMAGNVMEWCLNDKQDLETIDVTSVATKALRGGDWGYRLDNATCYYCDEEVPGRMDVLNGCRVVIGCTLMR